MTTEIRVPDLGDFKEVTVSELFVKPGDVVKLDQPIVAVESDKATMDIPSPIAGRILSIEVQLGGRVSAASLLATIEASEREAVSTNVSRPTDVPGVVQDPSGAAAAFDVVVIGGGPGGYSAAFRAADLGLKAALVERHDSLGGVCLNVGCIPSKALLHTAAVLEEASRLGEHGVLFAPPEIDLEKLRGFKGKTVKRLTDGLAQMARMRKVTVIKGTAKFASPNALAVTSDGGLQEVTFKNCIVAAGSEPIRLPFLPDDPRIVDSTGALELPTIPQRMLVIGGGIIGLEMATVYSALGATIDVVEQFDGLLAGVDRDLVAVWMKRNSHRFERVMLSTKVDAIEAIENGLRASFGGDEHRTQQYDLVLQAAGRRPNGAALDLELAGVAADGGFIRVDSEMRSSVSHIFAVGDIADQPMLAHKAVHQGHVAAEVIAGKKSAFDPMAIPSVAYLDPEIAWAGITEDAAKAEGRAVEVGRFPWAASGRAVANGADYGMTKLIFDKDTGRIVGGAVVGPNAGDLIGEICLAIEMGADALDIAKTIHPHPTLTETIGMAAEMAEGVCTDLPPKARS